MHRLWDILFMVTLYTADFVYSSFPQTWHWVSGKRFRVPKSRVSFQSTFVVPRYKGSLKTNSGFRNPESCSRKPSAMSAGTSCSKRTRALTNENFYTAFDNTLPGSRSRSLTSHRRWALLNYLACTLYTYTHTYTLAHTHIHVLFKAER